MKMWYKSVPNLVVSKEKADPQAGQLCEVTEY